MSWIDEAKQKAQERARQESDGKAALQRERDRMISMFHKATNKTRSEIELVIAEARSQGLKVSPLEEGFVVNNYNCGNFMSFSVDRHSSDLSDFYTYVISWVIQDPATSKNITLRLGVNYSKKTTLFGKVVESYTPTITASQFKENIKAWLIQIYSS